MAETVDFDVSSLERLIKRLEDRGRNVSRVTPLVANILVTAVEDQFETEGGGNWPPLAASTLAARRGTTAKILQDTGVLVGSIRPDHGSDWASAGTDVPYARYHVTGTGKMPARNFLLIDEGDTLREIEDVLVAELISGRA